MDEGLIKRVLPHSIEAERSVVGSMIMDSEAVITASEIVTKDDFYGKQYGILFEAMVELYSDGKPIDLVTLQDKLKEKNVPPELSSVEFIRDIVASVPTSTNVKSYAGIVKDKSTLRRIIKTNEEIENIFMDSGYSRMPIHTGNDIDQKAGKRPVAGMLDLTDIFEEIIHGFNDSTLSEQQLIGILHQLILHILFDFSDQLNAPVPKPFKQFWGQISFVSKEFSVHMTR